MDWDSFFKKVDAAKETYQLATTAPQVDPRYKQLQEAQIKQAQDFRAAIPKTAEGLMRTERENSLKALGQNMTALDRGASRRGLLYGGLRAGGRANAMTGAMQELSQKRAGINSQLATTADAMEKQAMETGFGMAGANQNMQSAQDAINRQQIASQMTSSQGTFNALGGIGAGIGQGVGYYLGSKGNSNNSNNGNSSPFGNATNAPGYGNSPFGGATTIRNR